MPRKKKTETICVRFSHEDTEMLKDIATACNQSVSDFLRSRVVEALHRIVENEECDAGREG
jgi:uncharacterized protein (DUF1778 family)